MNKSWRFFSNALLIRVLSLFMLTDLWSSPRSRMKNFRTGNQGKRHAVGGFEWGLGSATANIDQRSALELGRYLWRLLGGADTPSRDVGWSSPDGLLEHCYWRLGDAGKLARKGAPAG